jgi:hypothetical protein
MRLFGIYEGNFKNLIPIRTIRVYSGDGIFFHYVSAFYREMKFYNKIDRRFSPHIQTHFLHPE